MSKLQIFLQFASVAFSSRTSAANSSSHFKEHHESISYPSSYVRQDYQDPKPSMRDTLAPVKAPGGGFAPSTFVLTTLASSEPTESTHYPKARSRTFSISGTQDRLPTPIRHSPPLTRVIDDPSESAEELSSPHSSFQSVFGGLSEPNTPEFRESWNSFGTNLSHRRGSLPHVL